MLLTVTTGSTHNFLTCCILRHTRCYVWPWLVEYNDVVMSCFMLSRSTSFAEVSPIKPEDSPTLLFKEILHSVSWDRKIVNSHAYIRKRRTGLQIKFTDFATVFFRLRHPWTLVKKKKKNSPWTLKQVEFSRVPLTCIEHHGIHVLSSVNEHADIK